VSFGWRTRVRGGSPGNFLRLAGQFAELEKPGCNNSGYMINLKFKKQ
jgi:hypothetical protein